MKSIIETREAMDGRGANASLLEVLMFLERRGVSSQVIELAMRRAGIQEDVAQLLSRCMGTAQAAPRAARLPDASRTGKAAERALGRMASAAWTMFLVFGVGLAAGAALGYEFGLQFGLEVGLEAGLDRAAALLGGGAMSGD